MSDLLKRINEIPNPCYVLDEEKFIQNMETLNYVQKASGAKVLCALKGFSMWSAFPIVNKYLTGGTSSSLHEAKLISEEMGKKAHCCFVVYKEEEFDEVQSIASHITFNSLNQYNKYKDKFKPDIKYALRLNPEASNVEFEQYNPCMPGSRFGIVEELLPSDLPEGITGLHFHTLCESNSTDLEETLVVIEEKFGHLLHQASWINLGGGHHVTREDYDKELLIELLSNLKENYNLEVYIEPGEAIGWRTGYLVSKVEDVVKNSGETTAILNVSFSAHMPDCLEMPYKPGVIGETKEGEPMTLGGNTCMSGDFVKGFYFDKQLKEGDLVVFEDMMHYTFVKTSTFNGVEHPSIGIWKKENEFHLVRKFDYQNFKGRLS